MSNSLASVHPELIPEWSERNLPLTPDKITFGSNKRVWWKGACGHEWETSVKARSKGEKCPICSGARVIEGINDLVTLKPLLAQEWSEKNKLKPTEVSVASHKKIIWKCKHGHEWEASVKSRTINGTGCPYCSHNKVLAGFNDLASQYPDIAAEWSDSNLPLLPTMVTAFANSKAWWKCRDCGNEWYTLISTRAGGSRCPYCILKTTKERRFHNMNIIETQNLTKTYGDFTAVSHLNLHIRKGSVYGFLGPNGAGKSTTMKMFLGLTQPTEGSFHIDGKTYPSDRVPILKEVGSFIEAPAFYGNLSGEENLEIIRKILGLPKSCVDDALELVGLTEFRKRLAKKYSLGMKQRLGLAGALIGRPPILILDEPTNGLDPVGIHEIRTLIRSLPQKYDCTVLVSSHLLPEVELMADDIGILNHGHLLFEGTKEELKTNARAAGFPTDNLEDTFLAMIDEDNRRRGGTV